MVGYQKERSLVERWKTCIALKRRGKKKKAKKDAKPPMRRKEAVGEGHLVDCRYEKSVLVILGRKK